MSSVQPPPSTPGPSSTLYAQPSKNWVIPPRPKPGRKPKKPVVEESGGEAETDETSKNKNRAAQRAFRERKQDQLVTLQNRLQQYEQGETERHVQLQALGKRLKEENDQLKKENTALKDEIARLKAEKDGAKVKTESMDIDLTGSVVARKRATTASASAGSGGDLGSRKRIRTSISYAPSPAADPSHLFNNNANSPSAYQSSSGSASTPAGTTATTPSSSSIVSSPSSISSPQNSASVTETLRLHREPTAPSSSSSSFKHPHQHSRPNGPRIVDKSSSLYEPSSEIQIVDCGFCSENTPCVCRELAMSAAKKSAEALAALPPDDEESPPQQTQPERITPQSILDNLPEYQPPVPLRKRNQNTPSSSRSLFPVFTQSTSLPSTAAPPAASCSGDPSNCGACKDDPFGRAFCTALSDACADGKCTGCPGRERNLVEIEATTVSISSTHPGPSLSCCGDPEKCKQGCGVRPRSSVQTLQPSRNVAPSGPPSTIPTSIAWATLKDHPAIQQGSFTNLNLLADVVAKRTKCSGPKVVIEPAPGSLTPERVRSPAVGESGGVGVRCGRDRVREVRAEGVRDALAVLDKHLSQTD